MAHTVLINSYDKPSYAFLPTASLSKSNDEIPIF